MNIHTLVLGALATNCYLVENEQTKEAFLIDPAASAKRIKEEVDKAGVTVRAIYLTHGHFDHILAATELSAAFLAPIACMEQEKEVAEDGQLNLSARFAKETIVCPQVLLSDNEIVTAAGMKLCVLHTPGHTKGSCCYYLKEQGVLFSGDTLFLESTGRTDFPTGNSRALLSSVKERLFTLPDLVAVYPGHGGSTTIGYEKRSNAILWEE